MIARVLAVFGLFFLVATTNAQAGSITDTEELVQRSHLAIVNILDEPNFKKAHEFMREAEGVLIIPRLLKAGFVIGGEGGSGLLMVKGAAGDWSYPAFYTLAAGSVGFQIGVKDSQVLFIIRSKKAVEALLKDQVKLGGEASLTVGTFGGGVKGATTSNMNADILSFALARGAFGGGSFEGAVVGKRSDYNREYYGQEVSPEDILYGRTVSNPSADKLREVLAKF